MSNPPTSLNATEKFMFWPEVTTTDCVGTQPFDKGNGNTQFSFYSYIFIRHYSFEKRSPSIVILLGKCLLTSCQEWWHIKKMNWAILFKVQLLSPILLLWDHGSGSSKNIFRFLPMLLIFHVVCLTVYTSRKSHLWSRATRPCTRTSYHIMIHL